MAALAPASPRTLLNSGIEELYIHDIDKIDEGLKKARNMTDANTLVEDFRVRFKFTLDDADSIGYHDNQAIQNKAIETALLFMDDFVHITQFNKLAEEDLEEYCIWQIKQMHEYVKRYDQVGDDFKCKIVEIVTRYCELYVNERRQYDFDHFYKYILSMGLEKDKTYAKHSMKELGIQLSVNLITDFLERFRKDEKPKLMDYIEELEVLLDKMKFFDYFESKELTDLVVVTSLTMIDTGIERKYDKKEVCTQVTKRLTQILTKIGIISDAFWAELTSIYTKHMGLMLQRKERLEFNFYWLFSQEIGILDKEGGKITTVPGQLSLSSSSPVKKKPQSSGGLREL